MINERFKTYFETTFFNWRKEEFQSFIDAIEKPIPRSIRIKPGKEEVVKKRLEKDGWILNATPLARVYTLDRKADFSPLERRIWFSLDHLIGNFYIQELAAAHPVDILADSHIQSSEFLILDMASSPGGKTTQLAEYFPNSFIIANEPTRERIPQLLQNLDRMGSANIWVTLYPGQYWKTFPETFDRILLDAPCSGEWTLYKWTDATKHWHIKNIKNIASLQEKLFDAGLHALKVWGEMIYSTCSLNLLEDEWVLVSMQKKYHWIFEVLYEKKFWPHTDKTGGFFVVKLKKTASIERKEIPHERHANEEIKRWPSEIEGWTLQKGVSLYEHAGKILATTWVHLVEDLRKDVYFMRFWEYISTREKKEFTFRYNAFKYLSSPLVGERKIESESELDLYLRWGNLPWTNTDMYTKIVFDDETISLEKSQWDNSLSNSFPTDWRRI